MQNNRIAVIDLGTNTFDILIAEPKGKSFEPIFKDKIGVKIGKDGISKGLIQEDAQMRLMDALIQFAEQIKQFQVPLDKVYCVATSAFRNAKNQKPILEEIYNRTGFQVQVISGDEEATYIFEGVKNALQIGESNGLIVDIGGGSVEFIICNAKRIWWKKSFEIGAQRLYDAFMRTDPISDLDIQRLEIFLESELVELTSATFNYAPKCLIGSAGSFDTLSEMVIHQLFPNELDKWIDSNHELKIKEFEIELDEFDELYRDILLSNRTQRLTLKGMIELRVDMIVVAVCLIKFLLSRYDLEQIRVSAYALKEGYLLSKLGE